MILQMLFMASHFLLLMRSRLKIVFQRYLFLEFSKITKIVCLGYSFVLVIEHILGIIPGTSEMFPTYVLLALVPFSLYEMDMEHGIKFNVIYLICTFLIMLMTSKQSCILVLAVGIMGYFLVKAKVQGRNVKAIVNRMAKYILAIFAIFLAMYFVTKLMKLDNS